MFEGDVARRDGVGMTCWRGERKLLPPTVLRFGALMDVA